MAKTFSVHVQGKGQFYRTVSFINACREAKALSTVFQNCLVSVVSCNIWSDKFMPSYEAGEMIMAAAFRKDGYISYHKRACGRMVRYAR